MTAVLIDQTVKPSTDTRAWSTPSSVEGILNQKLKLAPEYPPRLMLRVMKAIMSL